MKVLFITREGYGLSGARVRCYNFSRELRRRGVESGVFSFGDDLGARYGEKEFEMSSFEKILLGLRAFHRLLREDARTIFVLQRMNYHAWAPLAVSFLKGNPVIFDCDDWNIREDPVYYFGFYPSSKMEYVTRCVARRARVCIAASTFLQEYLQQFNSRVYYVPTGVDTDFFVPSPRKDPSKTVFSWAGTAYHKDMGDNLSFLLSCFSDVASRCDNVFLSLAGEGRYFEQVKERIASHPCRDRITVHSWMSPDVMPEYLAGIDVGLLPLIQDTKFNKGKSPTKLFEYMSMAKAVVASNIGEACHSIRHGETGFLAGSREEFVSAMCLLAEDRALADAVGARARESVMSRYSLHILGESLLKIVRDL